MIERAKERWVLVRPLLIPFVLYLILLVFAVTWSENNPDSRWRYLIALLPMIPGLFIAAGVLRAIRKLDELAQKTLLEAIAISFGFTLILELSLGLLGIVGFPQPDSLYIALFMLIMALVGKLFLSRKYE
jgi:CDP-diglyceride synthetase